MDIKIPSQGTQSKPTAAVELEIPSHFTQAKAWRTRQTGESSNETDQ